MASVARKILHIGAISVSAAAVFLVPDIDRLLWVVLFLIPILGFLVSKGLFRDPISERRSWGIVYFAFVFALLLIFFRHSHPEFIYYSMLVLAWADGFAALVGEPWGSYRYRLGGDERSLQGSLVFFLTSFVCLWYGHLIFGELKRPFETFEMAMFVAAFLSLAEAISSRGRDNLWVPIGLVYWMLLSRDVSFSAVELLGYVGLPASAAYLAHRLKWLEASGAVAALLMGWIMLINPEPVWVFPALVFFISGTIASKLPGRKLKREENGRNAMQVFSNGGIPCLFLGLYFIFDEFAFLIGFLSGFAAAMSDTISSETGARFARNTFAIVGFKRVPKGLSGGVSLLGTFAGIAASFIFAGVCMFIFNEWNTQIFWLLVGVGVFGNVMDSILGQYLQISFLGKHTEEWGDQSPKDEIIETRGYDWVSNDMVNLFAVSLAAMVGVIIFKLL